MLTFTQRLCTSQAVAPLLTLWLTAEERTRSRHRFETLEGQALYFRLPRGTILRDGDLIQAETGEAIAIAAKPEPVLTVTATTLELLRSAYHLGNRHVPLEISSTYLRLSFDSVLKEMLENLGIKVYEEVAPFNPEIGAYRHNH